MSSSQQIPIIDTDNVYESQPAEEAWLTEMIAYHNNLGIHSHQEVLNLYDFDMTHPAQTQPQQPSNSNNFYTERSVSEYGDMYPLPESDMPSPIQPLQLAHTNSPVNWTNPNPFSPSLRDRPRRAVTASISPRTAPPSLPSLHTFQHISQPSPLSYPPLTTQDQAEISLLQQHRQSSAGVSNHKGKGKGKYFPPRKWSPTRLRRLAESGRPRNLPEHIPDDVDVEHIPIEELVEPWTRVESDPTLMPDSNHSVRISVGSRMSDWETEDTQVPFEVVVTDEAGHVVWDMRWVWGGES